LDNLCHTLVGAACGEAGLKHRTRYGNATLIIAANLPDIDVLSFVTDVDPISFRRGWTHGILAQLTLPVALTALVYAYGRLRSERPVVGGAPVSARPPLSAAWLLLLSFVGIYSHVFLDFLNNYGVRLLAPLDWRWFYGDAVFIADPWLWLSLGVGVWLSRRQGREAPARGALAFATLYVAVMLGSAQAARVVVTDMWRDTRGAAPVALMVGPLPATPFTRSVIIDVGDHYETGAFTWTPTHLTMDGEQIRKNSGDPRVKAARSAPRIREFLVWARFPFWTIEPDRQGARVTIGDVRFNSRSIRAARFQATTVVSAAGAASSGSSRRTDRR
jgi:inner membrane protein